MEIIKPNEFATPKIKWVEPVRVPEGKHTGVISKVEYRYEPYEYTDIFIKLDEHDVEIKYGVPTKLSSQTRLGRLMIEFGCECKTGEKVNPAEVLTGKKVQFMTMLKLKDGNDYAEIVRDSLRPYTH